MSSVNITHSNALVALHWLLTELAQGNSYSQADIKKWAKQARLVLRAPSLAKDRYPAIDTWSNEDRTEWADDALLDLCAATGGSQADALTDALCNLMHWADFEVDPVSWTPEDL
jgi:hypothetical protein